MGLSGTIETISLADVLQFLGLARKTGQLKLEWGRARKVLFVEEGRCVYCSSGGAKEYLGQHLLARTRLTEDGLERAFALQRQTGAKLGEILVSAGLLTQDELDAALRYKVADSIYDLFTWPCGRFEFDECSLPLSEMPVRLSLDWQDVIIEGARRCDEMMRIRALIPGPHVRFNLRTDLFPAGFPQAPGDQRLVSLVGEGLCVGDICPRFHASDLDVLQRLKELLEHGLIEIDPISLEQGRPVTRDEILHAGTKLLDRKDLIGSWETFREGLVSFPGDESLMAGLVTSEERLRQHFAKAMSDLNAVPRLAVSLEELAGRPLSSKQAFVVTRLTGEWTVRAITQVCPFDEVEALCILDSLIQQGLVELKAPVSS